MYSLVFCFCLVLNVNFECCWCNWWNWKYYLTVIASLSPCVVPLFEFECEIASNEWHSYTINNILEVILCIIERSSIEVMESRRPTSSENEFRVLSKSSLAAYCIEIAIEYVHTSSHHDSGWAVVIPTDVFNSIRIAQLIGCNVQKCPNPAVYRLSQKFFSVLWPTRISSWSHWHYTEVVTQFPRSQSWPVTAWDSAKKRTLSSRRFFFPCSRDGICWAGSSLVSL